MTTVARGLEPAAVGTYDRRGAARPEPVALNRDQIRERWKMGVEARALVLVTAVLLAFGLAVLYSASAIAAMQEGRSSAHYFLKQLSGIAAGMVAFAVAAKIDAERWRTWAWPLMGLAIFTMLLTVLPFTKSIAPPIHGSRRFLFGGSIQPSEFAKLAIIVWTSMLLVKKQESGTLRRLSKGMLPFLVVVGLLAVLAALEPDLSVAMMFVMIMAIILFAGGVRIGHFIALGIMGIPVLWHELERLNYVVQRLLAFLGTSDARAEISYQLKQSLVAVGSGGLLGVGFGEGRQQYGFLPFPYSDFIGSNIGEEWGFVGLTLLIGAYALYTWLGFRIARQARSPFLQLTAVGLTMMMALTAYLHIGVVIGLLPTTGLTLPFVSYGRSNMLLSLLMTGLLVNIGSERQRVVGETATDPLNA
ncbi:FtsW/RodA/SpoVE family cell cycle protein [Roseisolibacter sp. H3M3-2]|uniref:FtsW/RodA/SpoVE family cell cycle protein n=1 Tax=Roseisolibacter sp. H3M3-2 TaxID=3031323 RepID=UPI0023DC7599|nr:FtsW/RodA/SpoVE family cell cycle protein [Roseisolibacter sp. H3M3-2]MDF1504209.1 FtsW/RodA/SpoVE family cell cycle protein [Roseisolibacter sp. H3M3-2]